jgi:iron complex outermembrane recepter protein
VKRAMWSRVHASRAVVAAAAWATFSALGVTEAAAQQAPAGSSTASGPASDGDALETVVVTAQFRQQNLQQTPVAITAITGEQLEARGDTSLRDITASAPNVVLLPQQQGSGKSLLAYVRGVGQSDFNPAVEPGVGIYLDDVYYSSLTGADFALIDLDRIEVLRGPQGTLAGMNSLGGAIKLYSRKPDGKGGYVEASYGNFNHVGLRASGDFTVIPDKLFVRISGASVRQNGYVQMLDYACVHPNDPYVISGALPRDNNSPGCGIGDEGSTSYTSVRLAARWLPFDKLEANFTLDATQDNSTVVPSVLLQTTGVVNSIPYQGAPFDNRFVPYGGYRGDTVVNNPYVTYANFLDPGVTYQAVNIFGAPGAPNGVFATTPVERLQSWGTALTLDYQVLDNLALKSITSYRHYRSDSNADPDGSPIDIVQLSGYLTHRQVTQELRATGTALGHFLDYTLGAIYLDDTTYYESRVNSPFVPFGTPTEPTFDFMQNDPETTMSAGVYGHAGLHLTEALTADLGIRYTKDKKDYTFYRYNIDGTTPYLPLSNPANPLNGTVGRFDGSHVDYRAALDYQWTPDLMSYVQFSTGFKGGGVSPRPYFPQQAIGFGPETMKAYEIGLKSQWFDHRARVNLAAFYNQYDGYQAMADATACVDAQGHPLQPPYNAPCGEYLNVGDAEIKGVEGEFEVRPINRLTIDASVSWLDFAFVKSLSPAVRVGRTTPAGIGYWKWDSGVQYVIPFISGSSLVPRIDVNAMPGSCGDLACTPVVSIHPYTLVNGRLTFTPGGSLSDWSLAFEAKNLTDRVYYMQKFNAGSGFVGGQIGPPREWTVTVEKTF